MLSGTPGVHHVSAVGGDTQRNAEFYVAGSGLRPASLPDTLGFDLATERP